MWSFARKKHNSRLKALIAEEAFSYQLPPQTQQVQSIQLFITKWATEGHQSISQNNTLAQGNWGVAVATSQSWLRKTVIWSSYGVYIPQTWRNDIHYHYVSTLMQRLRINIGVSLIAKCAFCTPVLNQTFKRKLKVFKRPLPRWQVVHGKWMNSHQVAVCNCWSPKLRLKLPIYISPCISYAPVW